MQVRWYIYRMKYNTVNGVRTLEEEHIALKSGTVTPTFQSYSACQASSPKRRRDLASHNNSNSNSAADNTDTIYDVLDAETLRPDAAGDGKGNGGGNDGASRRNRRAVPNCGLLGSSCRRCTATEGCSWCASGGCAVTGSIARTTCSARRWYSPRDPSGNECPEDGKTNAITIDTKIDGVSGDINGLYAVHVVYEDGAHSSQPNHIIARRLVLYMPSSTLVMAGTLAMSNSYAPNTPPLNELWWNNGGSSQADAITVNFASHFYNDKLNHDDNWLNRVDPYAVGADYVPSLDQISGVLPVTGTPHYKGIIRYRGALLDAATTTPANSQLPLFSGLSTARSFPTTGLADGKEYKVAQAHVRMHAPCGAYLNAPPPMPISVPDPPSPPLPPGRPQMSRSSCQRRTSWAASRSARWPSDRTAARRG